MRGQTLFTVAIVLMAAWATAQAIVCTEEICKGIKCKDHATLQNECALKNAKFDLQGGFCGCCAGCIVQLGKGDRCFDFILGPNRHAECSEGLICHPNKKVCATLDSVRQSMANNL